MKKLLIIVIALAAICIGLLVWFLTRPAADVVVQQPPVQFPMGGSGGPNTTGGDSFLQNPDVTADVNNPGNYFIGNEPKTDTEVGSQPYVITYTADTKYFNITLTQEPIGKVRQSAELYLMDSLSLSKDQMCALNYGVYTPTFVNSQYAGTNLGFSFCPGAVKLP